MTPTPQRSISCQGFTLIELLVGSTVLCMMLTLLFSSLWFSVRSWESAERHRDATHALALVQSTLARQLRQARPIFDTDSTGQRVIAFRGGNDGLSYVAPLSRRDSALYLNTLFVAQDAHGRALRLHYAPWHPGLALDNGGVGHATPDNTIDLLADIQGLDIAYYGVGESGGAPVWQPTWTLPHSLPERIHIRIVASDAGTHDWPDLMVCLDGGADCLIPSVPGPDIRIAAARRQAHGS